MKYLEYNECKKRGVFDFPLEIHHVTEAHPQYKMPYHWHMDYEIIRILDGELRIFLDEEEFLAKSGDSLFISDGVLHTAIPNNCIYECIVFDIQLLYKENNACKIYFNKLFNHIIKVNPYFSYENIQIHNIIWKLFDSMYIKKTASIFFVQAYLYEFFGEIFSNVSYIQNTTENLNTQKKIMQLKKVLEYIEQNYSSIITLEQLSKVAHLSPKYFCRFFHEITHKTAFDYLNDYRIEQACLQLSNSDLSITEISLRCGFNDLSYFIKTFKKYKGITPKQFQILYSSL